MSSRSSVKTPKNQQGIALLIFIIVILLAFAAYTLSGLSISEFKTDQQKQTRAALKKAKEALIAYAVNYPEGHPMKGPGHLLCPDIDNDGIGETSCNGPATIGRFPWKTLNTGDLRDSSNERLWYAVSENFDFTASPGPKKLNTATTGNITVRDRFNAVIYDGTTINAAVAVIIAPGEALTRDDGVVQDRSAPNAEINYLDIHVASGEDNATFQQSTLDGFIEGEIWDGAGNVIVNDQIAVITYSEIMGQVHKRVSREIANLVNEYFDNCGVYPEASIFDPTKATFDSAGQGSTLELTQGHLPLNSALPVDWGDDCSQSGAPAINAPVPPVWLSSEDWHKVSYYIFEYTNPIYPYPALPAPAPVGTPCTLGATCLTANGTADPADQKESALIIFSGRDALANRPSTVMSDYYENKNNDGDLIFDNNENNDYVWIIAP